MQQIGKNMLQLCCLTLEQRFLTSSLVLTTSYFVSTQVYIEVDMVE